MNEILLYNECFTKTTKRLLDESVDVVCIDPPYLYLKNQVLEREFNEDFLFNECKRILKKDGFVVLFGRGVSFYRWNCILNDLGFVFKEEIIWNKKMISSPVSSIHRVHETISIFTVKNGIINKNKIPYVESRENDLEKIISDIKRIESAIKNKEVFKDIISYLETGEMNFCNNSKRKYTTTVTGAISEPHRGVRSFQAIQEGLVEKSIIPVIRDHYKMLHPTQKPVRLLERVLSLVIAKEKQPKEVLIADFFGGSFSTMEACYNLGFNGISCEINKEYYDLGKNRVDKLLNKPKLF